mmetsp:Transcript_20965/g.60095  ORF Transcript_20965/g.60095 Transcript_20965/m.60095 type:complete len:210 (-) Transcript_20965:1190-1819(-)
MKAHTAAQFMIFPAFAATCFADSTSQSSSFALAHGGRSKNSANASDSASGTNADAEVCGEECDANADSSSQYHESSSLNDEYQELVQNVNKRFQDAKNSQQPPPCTAECNYYGQLYCADESFRHIDMCNTCTCRKGGKVSCTFRYCDGPCDGPTCQYGFEGNVTSFCTGESWQATDGLNLCICDSEGVVHCTEEKKREIPRVMLRLLKP